ncbi:MAG TPA: response regulator [Syntrophomonadaceae bacterium]|nr:response regulator [Syntrophomonadaceae bacterium]
MNTVERLLPQIFIFTLLLTLFIQLNSAFVFDALAEDIILFSLTGVLAFIFLKRRNNRLVFTYASNITSFRTPPDKMKDECFTYRAISSNNKPDPIKKTRPMFNGHIGLLSFHARTYEITNANQKAAEIFGYSEPCEIIGKSMEMLLESPDAITPWVKQLQKDLVIYQYELLGCSRYGKSLNLELFAYYDEDNDTISTHIIDITENYQMDKKIKLQSYLLNNVERSILLINPQGEIVYCNQEAAHIFAIQNTDTLYTLSLPFDKEELEFVTNQVLQGKTWETEQSLSINGRKKSYHHHFHPLYESGVINYIVIISTDISNLVEARHNAEMANLVKSQFLANISHELRTPLFGILAASDLLEIKNIPSEQLEYITTIKECSEQLLVIIDELLEASRIDSGLMNINLTPTSLSELIHKCTSSIENKLWEKGLFLEVHIDPDLPAQIMLDELKVRQVLNNILSNATKYTCSGLITIDVSAARSGSQEKLIFSISDTGIGIPQHQLENVFNLFARVDNSSHRQFGGAGLGLYISKHLVELMSGEITIQSETGFGTKVSITLPLQPYTVENHSINCNEQEICLDHSAAETWIAFPDHAPVSILLAEDNPLNQKLISHMLSEYGYSVKVTANGIDCLHELQQHPYDLVLMDMQMPVMDGYEAVKIIRSTPALAEIPVIAITAHALKDDREKCLQVGCNSYLAKPFKSHELLAEIQQQYRETLTHPAGNTETQQIIQELMPEFLESFQEMLNELEEHTNNQNWTGIQDTAHAIKGTAGMYGFMDIYECAFLTEQAARNQNQGQLDPLMIQLQSIYRELLQAEV